MVDWPHAPAHLDLGAGAYMVTSSTYRKEHLFRGRERLSLLRDALFTLSEKYGWRLQAWAVFSNHYHFIALSPEDVSTLRKLITHLHTATTAAVNRMDGTPGRRVWFQYWDTRLSHEGSYLARLRYVHQNPVHHGIAADARAYEWCSAAWFEMKADRPFLKTVENVKTDRVTVYDQF